jgi:hypothetical protein
MNKSEREEFRLEILRVLCETLNFDVTKKLEDTNAIFRLFPGKDHGDIIREIFCLGEKGYLTYDIWYLSGDTMPIKIQLRSKAIELIEK